MPFVDARISTQSVVDDDEIVVNVAPPDTLRFAALTPALIT
jgi:hypothetical protein